MQQTPMMNQYFELKKQHAECILFFRLGDFYEMFGADAETAARELDLTLTSRSKNVPDEERIPMCGVPYHAAEGYIAKLLAKGYKVAICEQTEDPKEAKGLVSRDIVRIITPGTAIESAMLSETRNNFLAAVGLHASAIGLALCDISTGEALCTGFSGPEAKSRLFSELARYVPAEVILGEEASMEKDIGPYISEHFHTSLQKGLQKDRPQRYEELVREQFTASEAATPTYAERPEVLEACAILLLYLRKTQKIELSHMRNLVQYSVSQTMELDLTARRNLELTETLRSGEKKGTLLWVLDRTRTPMGGRLLRSWIEKPLLSPSAIDRRLTAVEELLKDNRLRDQIFAEFKGISDMERIVSRIAYGTANGRDLRALAEAAGHLPAVLGLLDGTGSGLLREIYERIDPLEDLIQQIDRAIVEDPPLLLREGGIIRPGYHAEVDQFREILSGGRGVIASIEAAEKEKTGIKTLKVGYNRVFGYYIEVRQSGYDQIPPHYIRKQTLSDRERYITEELKEMEKTILSASDKVMALEYELFCELRSTIAAEYARIQRTAQAIAQLDVLCAFAETAFRERYVRPVVDESDCIDIVDGRHPVVEKVLKNSLFVPNDTKMDGRENLVSIITGPNMAGKSTYMRQVGILVLMAQIGSFVPARAARIGIVDRIFTRIGASDDLAAGQSTFMVEMTEVAQILRGATPKSLLILDEIGRGTSTFDGMAIARAVLEWAANPKKLGAKTLFATHYHELTELEDALEGVKNYNIAVKKRGREIIFLRKIIRGGADDSYGIEVARLAGIPDAVIKRADEILEALEAGTAVCTSPTGLTKSVQEEAQISLQDLGALEAAERLRRTDPNTLTPLEALNLVYELKKML